MNTLRAKSALLLVISIVAVVASITIAMMYAFRKPKKDVAEMLAERPWPNDFPRRHSPGRWDIRISNGPSGGLIQIVELPTVPA